MSRQQTVFYNSSRTAVDRHFSPDESTPSDRSQEAPKNKPPQPSLRVPECTSSPNQPSTSCHGSSSGYSSSDSSARVHPYEEEHGEAVAVLRETAKLIIQEEAEMKTFSKALQKRERFRPHYECLTGAMLKRLKIQEESMEEFGDRHAIDDHLRIYGYKKEREDVEKAAQIKLARWILGNPIEEGVQKWMMSWV